MKNFKFKGKIITVTRKRTRLPNGYMADMDFVVHPGAVLIVPFVNPQEILMLRQYRPVIGKYLYELPAGTLKIKENVLSCARRELNEETGYTAKKLSLLGKIYPVPGYSTEIISIYEAFELKEKAMPKEPDEVIQVHRFKKSRVLKMFKRGHIRDAKTICALAFCGWLN
ncbi:MAG: hypothetical protein A2787_03145 [Omnitrophica WOR_2 bacterium RIFCSPHIGHO2_01_FULL_48_9]|nr:MAG: hypothetical protein A3D10_01190 [Omnitrophica WOR_2 bacterium RIFCSPHIGHO2_02_FULL_48_11]OGX32014.1 MAG: hypothetical protein A2787_03145 [Omnitrophica WOR_2 bacterium RIFCSPHIGHO2_01_FULL_48_9]